MTAKLFILKTIKEKPCTGYRLKKLSKKYFGKELSTGTIYPILQEFDKKGLIKKTDKGYKILKKGKYQLVVYMNNGQKKIKQLKELVK